MSAARVFADTNVFVYAFDRDAGAKQRRALEILETLGTDGSLVLSTQVLQEFYVSATRKLRPPLSDADAATAVRRLTVLDVVEVDVALILMAIETCARQKLSLWDALIVEAAQARDCAVLLTEDLQNGRQFGSLRVENPFRPSS